MFIQPFLVGFAKYVYSVTLRHMQNLFTKHQKPQYEKEELSEKRGNTRTVAGEDCHEWWEGGTKAVKVVDTHGINEGGGQGERV
jgi:hypothetical protein